MRSRSQNVLPTSISGSDNVLPSSSTRNIVFKTPTRTLKHGRAAQNENMINGYPKTTGVTVRKRSNDMVFGTPALVPLLRSRLKTDKIPRTASRLAALSEITNKTPFNKHQVLVTPGPAVSLKSSNLLTPYNAALETSARRISSTRKKLRLPRSAGKRFETPETKGDHWDVSDISIETSLIDEACETAEDYDDVEYGPPTAIDPTYDPPFELPDYKEVGRKLMSYFRQTMIPDDYDSKAIFDDTELLTELAKLHCEEKLELPEIPVENIFPLMTRSKSPATNEEHVRLNAPAKASRYSKFEFSARVNPPTSSRKPLPRVSTLPSKPMSNTTDRTKGSHRRISKSRHEETSSISQITTSYLRPSSSYIGTAIVPRSGVSSILQKGNLGVAKPLKRAKAHLRQHPPENLSEDVMQLLFAASGDEIIDEEFLFDV